MKKIKETNHIYFAFLATILAIVGTIVFLFTYAIKIDIQGLSDVLSFKGYEMILGASDKITTSETTYYEYLVINPISMTSFYVLVISIIISFMKIKNKKIEYFISSGLLFLVSLSYILSPVIAPLGYANGFNTVTVLGVYYGVGSIIGGLITVIASAMFLIAGFIKD